MKKHLLWLICCGLPLGLCAQETAPTGTPARVREVGLANFPARGLDNGMHTLFRFGNERAVWRTMGSFAGTRSSFNSSLDVSLAGGREYRYRIARWLEIRGGGELALRRGHYTLRESRLPMNTFPDPLIVRDRNTQLGARLVGGVNFLVAQRMVLGAELLPGFTYNRRTFRDSNGFTNISSSNNFNFSRPPLLISAAYRF